MGSFKLADGSDNTDYKIGDKFEVVVVELEDLGLFAVGDKVTLNCDTLEDSCPEFLVNSKGEFIYWWQLKPVSNNKYKVGAKVELLKDAGIISSGDVLFEKGDICTIFGYTEVCGEPIPIIQDVLGCVTTYCEDLLKVPDSLDDKLIGTLEEYYTLGSLDNLVEDIKLGKIEGLKYVGEGNE